MAVTNHDIEIAFVQAQQRINEAIDRAQSEFYLPDMEQVTGTLASIVTRGETPQQNPNNPIMNEEM